MKFLLFVLSFFVFHHLDAQKFPFLNGELLNNESIELPKDCVGKYSLIGLAHSQKAEEELRTWYDPSIDKFILKRGMFDSEYDVNIYFIPMFHGVKKMAYDKSFKKIKQLTDERLYKHVIFYKGEIKNYKEVLDIDQKDRPVFFLLDPEGNILKRFEGRFREIYFEELIEIIDNAG